MGCAVSSCRATCVSNRRKGLVQRSDLRPLDDLVAIGEVSLADQCCGSDHLASVVGQRQPARRFWKLQFGGACGVESPHIADAILLLVVVHAPIDVEVRACADWETAVMYQPGRISEPACRTGCSRLILQAGDAQADATVMSASADSC